MQNLVAGPGFENTSATERQAQIFKYSLQCNTGVERTPVCLTQQRSVQAGHNQMRKLSCLSEYMVRKVLQHSEES